MERALKHKYSVGETVYFTASNVARPAASGTYEVVRLLPTDGDDCQYRIKNSTEAFEGGAKESKPNFPKGNPEWRGEAEPFSPAVKRPGSQDHSAHDECGERHSLSRNALYAALRDIAHELGLGYIARSTLACADLSD